MQIFLSSSNNFNFTLKKFWMQRNANFFFQLWMIHIICVWKNWSSIYIKQNSHKFYRLTTAYRLYFWFFCYQIVAKFKVVDVLKFFRTKTLTQLPVLMRIIYRPINEWSNGGTVSSSDPKFLSQSIVNQSNNWFWCLIANFVCQMLILKTSQVKNPDQVN